MKSENIEFYLEKKIDSVDGLELKAALKKSITEEKLCLDLFKSEIRHCKNQITMINNVLATGRGDHDMIIKKNAFEDEQIILNVAALCQLC